MPADYQASLCLPITNRNNLPKDRIHKMYRCGLIAAPFVAGSIGLLLGEWRSGPLAPASLIVPGIVLMKLKRIAPLTGILIVPGGIVFTLGRISRTEWAAHIADILLLIPLTILW